MMVDVSLLQRLALALDKRPWTGWCRREPSSWTPTDEEAADPRFADFPGMQAVGLRHSGGNPMSNLTVS